MLIKHQTPHLNTLPISLSHCLGVFHGAMDRPPRPRRLVAVEALDERHLVRVLSVLEVPPVLRVRLDRPRLLPPTRLGDKDGCRNQV